MKYPRAERFLPKPSLGIILSVLVWDERVPGCESSSCQS
jgi:hypothetical protein